MVSNQQKLILMSVATIVVTVIGTQVWRTNVVISELRREPIVSATAASSESYGADHDFASKASGASVNEFNQLKAEIKDLKQALNETIELRSTQQADTSTLQDNDAKVTDSKIPVSEEEEIQIIESRQALYAAQVMSEPVDLEWSRETLSQIETALDNEELQGLNLISSTCGSTLCQLEMKANDLMPMEQSMQNLSMQRPWDGPTFFKMEDNGKVTLFFARSGHELPNDEIL